MVQGGVRGSAYLGLDPCGAGGLSLLKTLQSRYLTSCGAAGHCAVPLPLLPLLLVSTVAKSYIMNNNMCLDVLWTMFVLQRSFSSFFGVSALI